MFDVDFNIQEFTSGYYGVRCDSQGDAYLFCKHLAQYNLVWDDTTSVDQTNTKWGRKNYICYFYNPIEKCLVALDDQVYFSDNHIGLYAYSILVFK